MNSKAKRTNIAVALLACAITAAVTLFPQVSSAEKQTQNMLLVELFTSQGCSSCPPADKIFSKLAEDEKIAVLAWHVPYWDYIGWKDPFSIKEAENRQRKYARRLQTNQVYTPQALVAGKKQLVGSNERSLGRTMRAEMRAASENEAQNNAPQLNIQRSGAESTRQFNLNIVKNKLAKESSTKFDISLVLFQAAASTDVKRGENRGRRINDANIVRQVKKIGSWDGADDKKISFRLPNKNGNFDVMRDGGFVIIAEPNDLSGAISATRWDFKRGFKPE